MLPTSWLDWARSATVSGFIVVGECLGSNIRGLGHGFGIATALPKEETDDGSFPVLVLARVSLSHKITS